MKKITLLFAVLLVSHLTHAQYLTEGFEGGTVIPPAGWTHTQTNTAETWEVSTNNPNSGTNYATVLYDPALNAQDETLITPVIDLSGATNPQLRFFVNLSYYWSISPNDNYDAVVSIFDGTNTTQLWEEADLGVFDNFTWIEVTLDLTAYAGNSNVQLLFNYNGTDGASLSIDDIVVEEAPTCIEPSLTFDDFSQTTVDISMDSVADFDIEWGAYPYTQGSGGNTTSITSSDTHQLTGLMPGVSYNVFVRQNCGGGDFSNYIEVLVGTSPSNLNTFPYSEDLEPDANQALLINLGISFAGTGNWNFNTDDTSDGDTTNDFAYDGTASMFSNNTSTTEDADARVYIGPFNLTTTNEYTFSFFQRNLDAASATRPNKDIEITVSTSNDGTNDSVILTLDDLDNTNYIERMATFTPTTDGDYYFGIHDKSSFLSGATEGNSVFVDAFSVTSQSLGINEFEANNFTHNYNKNLKTLNIKSSNLAITGIEIYSILGQNVISKSLANTTESIDVASLNDGVYLAKVNIGSNSKTIKFIKN